MKIWMFSLLLLSFSSFSLPTAKVSLLKGAVTFNGKSISQNDTLKMSGIIETGTKSLIRIQVAHWNTDIMIGPNSKMKLSLKNKEVTKKYEFLKGICRWRSLFRKISNSKLKGKIFTKEASVGVRGTDFLLKRNELLNETEIVMFDGVVYFKNLLVSGDEVLIKKGQWGGVGGRFGEKIGAVLNLPKEVLNHFKSSLKM